MVPPKIKNMFSWLDWIINEGLPFNTVEKQKTRLYSKLTPVSINTFMKAMHDLTVIVENTIKKLLPNKFALVFDGWTLEGTNTHYVGLFATFFTVLGIILYLHSYIIIILYFYV